MTQVYASLLSFALLAQPVTHSRRFAIHATIPSLAIFACYLYRDVWPLLTFTLRPTDGSGFLVLGTLLLAGIAGGVVPLCEPYPYIPHDPAAPQAVPSPEHTASLLSIVTYAVFDPLILASTKVAHLGLDALPAPLDTDDLAVLKPIASPYMYPRAGKPVRLLHGMLVAFPRSWATQAALYTLVPLLQLGAPVGTNRLLAYLEAGGAGAVVRPWVWIAWIALAPLVTALVSNLNQYVNGRLYVQIESLITALVYDQALRIRVVHSPDDYVDAGNHDVDRGAPSTPLTTASGTYGGESGKTMDEKKEKGRMKDLVGRLNNLVTSGE
jgi:hypothetical protein